MKVRKDKIAKIIKIIKIKSTLTQNEFSVQIRQVKTPQCARLCTIKTSEQRPGQQVGPLAGGAEMIYGYDFGSIASRRARLVTFRIVPHTPTYTRCVPNT